MTQQDYIPFCKLYRGGTIVNNDNPYHQRERYVNRKQTYEEYFLGFIWDTEAVAVIKAIQKNMPIEDFPAFLAWNVDWRLDKIAYSNNLYSPEDRTKEGLLKRYNNL